MNQEIPDVHAGFRKGRGTRDQIANDIFHRTRTKKFHNSHGNTKDPE